MLIHTFKVRDEFVGFYLLKEIEVKQTNAVPAKDYFDIILADSSGQISAKQWEVSVQDKETFFPMTLVKVQGIVQSYRDKLQVKIIKMRPATEADGVSLTDYIKAAPISSVDLVQTIKQTAQAIEHEQVKQIVNYCVTKVEEKLTHYPAAKTFHHAYFGGLAYHIVRMLELGEFVCKQRPFLNRDLVRAGIILHDIAKPEEMIAQLGVVSDYSDQGKLIGHIVLATNWIVEAALHHQIPLESEIVMALQHIVLAHHNLPEWGSPVQPQIAEAVALHYIDALDAKLQMVEDALQELHEDQTWTPMLRGLDNKALYRLK